MQAQLAELGAPLKTHYVQGNAWHASDDLRDPTFYQWLLSCRAPYPKSVHFVATNLRDNSAGG